MIKSCRWNGRLSKCGTKLKKYLLAVLYIRVAGHARVRGRIKNAGWWNNDLTRALERKKGVLFAEITSYK